MSMEDLQKKEINAPAPDIGRSIIIESTYKTLGGESFEDTAEALDNLKALLRFRNKLRNDNEPFSSFHKVIEGITNINKAGLNKEEKKDRVESLTCAMMERANRFSPRVADLYMAILAEIKGEKYEPKFSMTAGKIAELKKSGDLAILFSPRASWEMKLNRIKTRLTGYLLGARALDKREGNEMDDDVRKWREKEIEKMPKMPEEDTDESEPGVDPMEREKEGEPTPAIWRIKEAYNRYCKYFREKAFNEWDAKSNRWIGTYQYSDAETIALSGNTDEKKGHIDLIETANIRAGKRVRVPIPYTHSVSKVEAEGRRVKVEQNQNGDISVFVEGDGEVQVKIYLAPHLDKKFKSNPRLVRTPEMPCEFSEETEKKLEEIKNKKRGNIERARAIAAYVRSRVKYLAPKDRAESEKYNSAYRNHPKGFAGAVDEIKEGDCDVVNTYFSALCAKLNIPTRHIVGHSVDEDEDGSLITHFGTGHAWTEVWDEVKKEWVFMDATPAGDPNLEESEEKASDKHQPMDLGEHEEAIGPTDEELEKLRQKLEERKKELSYTREERQLSECTGVELKEAREIVREIKEAEQTRLPNGERIMDALAGLFNAIVESRRAIASAYTGPVRRREGGERIEDIVRHKIGVLSGDTDPMSREKPVEKIKEEKIIGGFDLYVIGDKSGSMFRTVDGEALWKMQRRAIYLIFSALHRFERNLERAGLQKENALSVRTQGISFRDSNEIDLDKPLSPEFSPEDKVKLWHSLTSVGMGNGDPEALGIVYEQIKDEIAENEKRGVKDNRLRLVIACSDGGYVGDDDVKMQALAEELGRLKVVVVGMGLTETARSVKEVMTTEYSRGDIARDINDLPALIAKHLVWEAIKLFPEKAQRNAERIIKSSLEKFKNI